jgi:hypothetical protein
MEMRSEAHPYLGHTVRTVQSVRRRVQEVAAHLADAGM